MIDNVDLNAIQDHQAYITSGASLSFIAQDTTAPFFGTARLAANSRSRRCG
jgi:hypothetical protein